METQESGIDCEKPFYSKVFDQVKTPIVQYKGAIKFCPESKYIIHFGDQLSFVDVDVYLAKYELVSRETLQNIPLSVRILEDQKVPVVSDNAKGNNGGGDGSGGDSGKTVLSSPIEAMEGEEGSDALESFKKFDPYVIDYNEDFNKIRDKLDYENFQMFHIVENIENPGNDSLDIFLFLFGSKGLLINIKNSINLTIDLGIKFHQTNEVVVCN
jgi:hypothetical protein